MKNLQRAKDWLTRAKSNLARARAGRVSSEILYEDLCFDAQQAVEKALKALCVLNGIKFSKVHDIAYLMELLESGKIKIPARIDSHKMLP